jgi:GntP family gluconate:H+ symporter
VALLYVAGGIFALLPMPAFKRYQFWWLLLYGLLLIPLMFLLAKQTKTPVLYVAVPLLAGLSVMHGLVPPHPGPMAAIEVLKANVGKTIFYALIIGFPTAIVAGPLLAPLIARRVPFEPTGALAAQFTEKPEPALLPGFAITVFTVLFPVLLMLLATAVDLLVPRETACAASSISSAIPFRRC